MVRQEEEDDMGACSAAAGNLEVSLGFLHQAIECLPEAERISFQKAHRLYPDLVQRETNLEVYLKFDNFNPWLTAKRLTAYWKAREDLFGDRAFRSLELSSEGILNQEEIQAIRDGVAAYSFLPPSKSGEVVLFHDRSRKGIRAWRMRLTFYFCAVLGLQKEAQDIGFRFIVNFGENTANFQRKGITFVRHIFRCIPTKFNGGIVCVSPLAQPQRRGILENMLPVALPRILETFAHNVVIYTQASCNEMLAALESAGLVADGIPMIFGGNFPIKFTPSTTSIEAIKHSNPELLLKATSLSSVVSDFVVRTTATKGFEERASSPDILVETGNTSQSAKHGVNEEQETVREALVSQSPFKNDLALQSALAKSRRDRSEEEEGIVRRAKDIIYSRKKRQRQKERENTLVDQVEILKRRNQQLKQEEAHLRVLASQAMSTIGLITTFGQHEPSNAHSMVSMMRGPTNHSLGEGLRFGFPSLQFTGTALPPGMVSNQLFSLPDFPCIRSQSASTPNHPYLHDQMNRASNPSDPSPENRSSV